MAVTFAFHSYEVVIKDAGHADVILDRIAEVVDALVAGLVGWLLWTGRA